MQRYKIADVVFDADLKYDYTEIVARDYVYEGEVSPAFTVKASQEEINEFKKETPALSDGYVESLVVFKRLCEYLLGVGDGIIFHSSAVAVDGEAYLFTAPSGTGKSTHTRYWRELLGDKAVMINDDKPIIRRVDGTFYVYGTPWTGKHRLGINARAKIKAICKIERGKDNSIEKIGIPEMFLTVLNQTLRIEKSDEENLLKLTEKLLTSVNLYRLKCNMSIDAAKLSYGVMSKGEAK